MESRAEINTIKKWKSIEKIDKTTSWLFDKINKIDVSNQAKKKK